MALPRVLPHIPRYISRGRFNTHTIIAAVHLRRPIITWTAGLLRPFRSNEMRLGRRRRRDEIDICTLMCAA